MIVRVRIHGRGGQGAKTASRILGDAAFAQGRMVQDFPLYGAERRGAPVEAFTRISDAEIEERGYIFDPDLVGVMDESLIDDPLARPIEGARSGAVVIVNTTKPASEVRTGRDDIKVVALDLTGKVLRAVGKPILSAVMAAALARVISISESSMLGAVESELKELGVQESLVSKNLEAAREVYNQLEPMALETREVEAGLQMATLETIVRGGGFEDVTSVGNSARRRTGDWRIFRPVIDYAKCTTCMVCYAYCPESAMVMNSAGKVEVDYDNCKGCMICMNECPTKAISGEREGELE